jgi:Protein of unknown function (DUF1475)
MILFLRVLFIVVLASMLGVTSWASLRGAVWSIPHDVLSHPWFIATLCDTYWAFLTFYVWVAYKETSWSARVLWLVAILALGNIAMATYCLIQLFRVKTNAKFESVLLRSTTTRS